MLAYINKHIHLLYMCLSVCVCARTCVCVREKVKGLLLEEMLMFR